YYQWIDGGRFAEIPADHGGRRLFKPAFDREMIAEGRDSKRKRDKASARKVVRIRPGAKTVVLGATGSIAAYKSAELASLLVKQGHEVFVVMTQDATEFISPLTLQTLSKNPVTTSFFDEKESWRPGHIELADRAKFLVTAGPTREPIDPVRYISNRSSGKMGYAIAEAVLAEGHDVTLISGPVNLDPPHDAKLISVSTSDEMFEAVHQYTDKCDICVLCAAVADYKPAHVSSTKIKKQSDKFSLELVPTRDILNSLGQRQDRQFVLVGFAAETDHLEENATKKLRAKNCDIIVANDVSDANSGLESDVNEVTILFRNGEKKKISRAQKKIIAYELVKIFSSFATKMFDKKNVTINGTRLSEVIPNSSQSSARVADERGELVAGQEEKCSKEK